MGKFPANSTANRIAEQWESLKDDPLVDLRTFAETLGSISMDTVRRWAREKKFITVKVGGRLRVRKSEALRLIKGYEVNDAETVQRL